MPLEPHPPDPSLHPCDGAAAPASPTSISLHSQPPSHPAIDLRSSAPDLPNHGRSSGVPCPSSPESAPAPPAARVAHDGRYPASTRSSLAAGIQAQLPSLATSSTSLPFMEVKLLEDELAGDVHASNLDQVIVEDVVDSDDDDDASPFHPSGASVGRSKARRWADGYSGVGGCSDDEPTPAAARPSYLDAARRALRALSPPAAAVGGAGGKRRRRRRSGTTAAAVRLPTQGCLGLQQAARIPVLQRLGSRPNVDADGFLTVVGRAVRSKRKRQRRRRRKRARADAAGSVAAPATTGRVPAHLRLGRVPVHQRLGPCRRASAPDNNGWQRVLPQRPEQERVPRALPRCGKPHHRQPTGLRAKPRAVEGRCFNCLASGHRVANCRRSLRCLNCHGENHFAHDCKWPRSPGSGTTRNDDSFVRQHRHGSPGTPPRAGGETLSPTSAGTPQAADSRAQPMVVSPDDGDVVPPSMPSSAQPTVHSDWWTEGVGNELAGARPPDRPSGCTPSLTTDWWTDICVQIELAGPADVRGGVVVEPQLASRELVVPDHGSQCLGNLPTSVEDVHIFGDSQGPGSLLSLDGEEDMGTVDHVSVQDRLEAAICVPLTTPLLPKGPCLRRSKTPVSILRWSGRIAAQSRAANTTVQAQRILLKKLGFQVEEDAADRDVAKAFKLAFKGDMSERKQRRLQTLLGGGFDVAALDLNLTGLEDEPNRVVTHIFSPLFMACFGHSFKCLKLLVEAGADVNFVSPTERTVLFDVVEYGYADFVRFLLEAGADPNIPDGNGRLPIMLAATREKHELVEILLPQTKPIPSVPDWSVDGIIRTMKLIQSSEPRELVEKRLADAKSQGKEAFAEGRYIAATYYYLQAKEIDPQDATILSNLSLCLLRMKEGEMALKYARECKALRPDWFKAWYREGMALSFLKNYKGAVDALDQALKLDPANNEIKEALREALEAHVSSVLDGESP